ncbi:hypothetical protein TrST_g9575 [Triparma strigata]|uniref:Uncharacterized protein n=1 Tax=Triparma strigata TaxID=1606541 RepID=A0A9W7BRV7_9STRA|nr:hypothetical protein TrST_g9575 [Triparma strigata]
MEESKAGAVEASIELEHAIGFSGTPGCLFYHPSGEHFVFAAGGTVVIQSFLDPHDQHFLSGHTGPITCMCMSKSGRYFASGQNGEDSDVLVWDFESKKMLYRLSEHDHGVKCISFSDDELLLCTVGIDSDEKMIIWDLSNGYIVCNQKSNPQPTNCVTWGGMVKDIKRRDTDKYLLVTSGAKTSVLWELDPFLGELTAEQVHTTGRGEQVRENTIVDFSGDKETIYCGTTSGDFGLINVRLKKLMKTVPACRLGILSLLSWPEGVICGGGDGTITTFDSRLIDRQQCKLDGPVIAMSFSPDKAELVAGTSTGFVYRVRLEGLQTLLVCENHCAHVKCVAYAPESSDKFATASMDNTIRIWDAGDYTVLTTATVKDAGAPTCLVYSLDMLITGWEDGKIRAHDVDSGSPLWIIDNAHRGGVTALALSHNQRFILTGGKEGEVRVWELRTRELVSHLKEHTLPVRSIALYEDNFHAISCSRDRSFLCWDLRSERKITSHQQRMGGINSVALSKDQTVVLTVGQERRVTSWDLRDQNPTNVRDLSPNLDDEAMTIALSHDGTLFATAGTSMLIKLWDLATLELLAVGEGHSGLVNDLKFSPDDRQIVSVGDDGNVFVWNCYV